jgi:hypothetical protein
MKALTVSILIVMFSYWFARKFSKVFEIKRRPFTCTKCMAFWLSCITFAIMNEPFYILPTYYLAVIYDANRL